MNTSIITSESSSLPNELIIKIVHYMDEKTIIEFTGTCKFVKRFNFMKYVLPYNFLYKYNTYMYNYIKNMRMTRMIWDEYNEGFMKYINYDFNIYIKSLVSIFNTINNENTTKRIRSQTNIIYKKSYITRHQSIREPIHKETHKFKLSRESAHRRRIETKQHSVMNINQMSYIYLRNRYFNVLALIY